MFVAQCLKKTLPRGIFPLCCVGLTCLLLERSYRVWDIYVADFNDIGKDVLHYYIIEGSIFFSFYHVSNSGTLAGLCGSWSGFCVHFDFGSHGRGFSSPEI